MALTTISHCEWNELTVTTSAEVHTVGITVKCRQLCQSECSDCQCDFNSASIPGQAVLQIHLRLRDCTRLMQLPFLASASLVHFPSHSSSSDTARCLHQGIISAVGYSVISNHSIMLQEATFVLCTVGLFRRRGGRPLTCSSCRLTVSVAGECCASSWTQVRPAQ